MKNNQRYKKTLEYRLKLRDRIDLTMITVIIVFIVLIFLNELGQINLNEIVSGKNILSSVLIFGILGVIRYRAFTCPHCQHSLQFMKNKSNFFEPLPNYCPNCKLDIKEVLGMSKKEHYPINIFKLSQNFFVIMFLMSLGVFGLYKIGFFHKADVYYVILPAIGTLMCIIGAVVLIGRLKSCQNCGQPFNTSKYCRRCGQ